MDKRYQVFVSSTYADLKDERRAVIQALLEMDCLPAGMELFPATDEEQFAFIKSVVNDCDYYLLIIGGRYGSLSPEGVSYTEQEYDYARSIGLQVLAFVHDAPGTIPLDKSELDPALRAKLDAFREKTKAGRLVKMWHEAKELPGLVVLSLLKTIKAHPAVGWIRADKVASNEVLTEINLLRKRNEWLELQIQQATPLVTNLARLEEVVALTGHHSSQSYGTVAWQFTVTWSDLFVAIAPHIMGQPTDALMHSYFQLTVGDLFKRSGKSKLNNWVVDDGVYQKAKLQFVALSLCKVEMVDTLNGRQALFWSLTAKGHSTLLELGTAKQSVAGA